MPSKDRRNLHSLKQGVELSEIIRKKKQNLRLILHALVIYIPETSNVPLKGNPLLVNSKDIIIRYL